MEFNQEVRKFKVTELSKISHKFDKSLIVDIRPFSFKSVQNKPMHEIKFNEVYMLGVAEKAFDQLMFDIPEMAKTSDDFKSLFINSFEEASASKYSIFGDQIFYPNFSELAYKLKINKNTNDELKLNSIDELVSRIIIGNIPEMIHQKCVNQFGNDYAKKCSKDFAEEYPKIKEELDRDFNLKNKRAS